MKGCQPELDQQELGRALLNFCVALCRSVEARDGLVLAAEAGEFTVDGHEDGVIDGGLDQRKLVRKVLARDLHFLGAGLLRPPEERFDPRREVSLLSTSTFGRGIVGCVGQLSVGQMFDVELLQRAGDGRNVDACQDVTDDTFLLNVPYSIYWLSD